MHLTSDPAAAQPAPISVPCPRCQTPTPFARSNVWRPFCSERCKTGDLGAWATGEYALPARPDDDEDEADMSETRDGDRF